MNNAIKIRRAAWHVIVLAVGTWSTACVDGPSIIDHPDYSSFLDHGQITADADDTTDSSVRDDVATPDPGWTDSIDEPGDTDHDTRPADVESPDTPDVVLTDLVDTGYLPDLVEPDVWQDQGVDTSYPDLTEIIEDTGTDYGTGEYTGIYEGMGDLAGVTLVQAICPLVRNGTTTVSYDNAKDILREDVDNYGGQIQEIYTGQWWDPDASIINVEHTWPQSKGAGSAPAQGDMHHLYLSHSYYNSARSNYPFGYVVDISYDGNDVAPFPDADCTDKFPGSDETGCFSYVGDDSLGDRVSEPRDAHKGNTARAVFYFQLRYGSSNCSLKPLSDFDNYGSAHVALTEETLKEWNRLDPPDAHERDRNGRIESHEGVRNPFIDHPEFVDRIDFTP